jgi:hypothetical protein
VVGETAMHVSLFVFKHFQFGLFVQQPYQTLKSTTQLKRHSNPAAGNVKINIAKKN